jgi:hypothetical protein
MISISTRRKALLIRLVIALVGLLAIVFSVLIPEKIAGLPVQEITRELATFVIASLLVHWIYETYMKHEILQDVTDFVIKRGNVSRSGIADYCENTKDIDYTDILSKSSCVIIGLHYAPRIIEDNFQLLAQRAGQGKETIIIASAADGHALDFLRRVRGESDHVDANIKKISSLIREINKARPKQPVRLLHHDEVLRVRLIKT